MGYLYLVSGPRDYVGITSKSVESRFAEHIKSAHKGARSYLHRAIRKHGPERFTVKTLVEASDWEYLCGLEKAAIKKFQTLAPSGYNATSGGDGVVGLDLTTKEKHRLNTAIATKEAWATSTLRENRAKSQARPEFKELHRKATSDGVKRMYADPVKLQKTLDALTSPAKREKSKTQMLRQWTDPDYRASQLAKRRARLPRSEESKQKQSVLMIALIAKRKAEGTYWMNK
jgi:hypothetical protein